MTSGSTPGPWHVFGRAIFAGDREIGLASHPRDVETSPAGYKYVETYDEAISNAEMFGAAPELYEALKLVLPMAKGYLARNNVGSNGLYVKNADDLLARIDKSERQSK